MIEETLPKAWNKVIDSPDETLVDLIMETTEKLCGYRPEYISVERFITSRLQRIEPPPFQKPGVVTTRPISATHKRAVETGESYMNKSISSFVFKRTRYEVKSWKDMLIQICNIMLATHRDRFEQVLNLVGRKRPYFTRNQNELRAPERIDGTDIYVEVHLSSDSIVKLSIDILALFGYTRDDLSIGAQ